MAVDGHLNFDTKINTKGFTSGIGTIGKGLNSLKGALGSVAAAVGVAFSVTAVVNFAKTCKAAYDVQITQETKLATIMKQRMNSSNAEIQAIKDLASAQQELGIIGDEVQLAGAQQVATFLNEEESLKALLPAMNNLLAQQKGVNATTGDAVNIGNMFGKVMQGQTSALKRVGITFSDAEEQVLKYGNETERAAMLAKVITNNVGEMNSVLAQTDMGRQKQLSNTLGDIQEQFGKAVQQIEILFLPALSRLSSFLSSVAVQAQKVAQAIANVFGVKSTGSNVPASGAADADTDLTDTTNATADTSAEAAQNYADIADSAEQAAEANKESLASFDELNVLSKDDTDGVNATVQADTDSAEAAAEEIADVINSADTTLEVDTDTGVAETSIDRFIQRVKSGWEELKDLFEPLKEKLIGLWETLQMVGNFAGENLLNFYNHFLKPLGEWVIGKGLPKLVEIIDKTLQSIDWEKINKALDDLYKKIEPFAENVGEGLLWFCENILSPLTTWVTNDVVPVFLEILGEAVEVLDGILRAAKDVFLWLWDEFLCPIAEWTGGIIVSVLESIADALGKLSDWINEHQETVQNFIIIIGTLGTALGIAWIIYSAVTAFTALGGIMSVVSAIGGVLSGVMAFLTSPITLVAIAIAGLIAIGVMLYKNWDEIKEFGLMCWETIKEGLSAAWEKVKNVFSEVGDFFKGVWKKISDGVESAFPGIVSSIKEYIDGVKKTFSGVIDFVKGVFTGDWEKAWNGIKEIFSGIWESFSAVIKTPINLVIDIVNKFISGIEDKINRLLDCVNTLSFDIPDWVPGIGGDHIGFDFSHIDIPEIPHLARGTVVPANYGEFLAVLGDNKKEREYVTPESDMTNAMINALQAVGLTGGSNDGDIVIVIDGREIFRVTKKEADKYKRTHGKPAFG